MYSKLTEYGLQFWFLCDSENYYCYNIVCTAEKLTTGYYVALDWCKPLYGAGRNLTTDNFFTWLVLARELLKHSITLVGTIKSNRWEVPKQVTQVKKRELHFSTVLFINTNNSCLLSYKCKLNKVVTLPFSQHKRTAVNRNSEKNSHKLFLTTIT